MKIKILDFYEKKEVGTINVRKNSSNKIIIKNIKEFLIQKYNCSIRNCLVTGNIDIVSHTNNLHYILFGENLPFREMSFEIINENKS